MPPYRTTIDDWFDALERAGKEPRRRDSDGSINALCPAHHDTEPSLFIELGDTGVVLVRCFSSVGCSFEDIRGALDLTPAKKSTTRSRRSRTRRSNRKRKELTAGPLPTGSPDEKVTRYDYVDATGKIVLVVTRVDHVDGGKHFMQCTPADKPDSFYYKGMGDTPQPLYRLPEIAGTETGSVAVVEGEKCVEACVSAWPDQPRVTTWAGGAKAWRRTDWTPLRGREVALVADGDDEGSHTVFKELANHLAVNLGCKVRLALPPLELNSDIADWLEEKGPEETRAMVAGLLRPFVPDETDAAAEDAQGDDRPQLNERMLAQAFAEHPETGDKWRFDSQAGIWRLWNGANWEEDQLEIIADVAQSLENSYRITEEGDAGLRRWQTRAAIMNVKELARVYAVQEFDPDPALLGLPWCSALDTRTALETEMRRDLFITKSLPDNIVKPSQSRNGPSEWESFIFDSLVAYSDSDREEVATFLQQWAGTALAGDCSAQLMIFAWGKPNSGKSTIGEVLLEMFGTYGATVNGKRVASEELQHLQWVAGLSGKRYVFIDELPAKGQWQIEVLAKLIDGKTVEANYMRQNSIEFRSHAHLLASSNHQPSASGAGGIWRRLALIHFTNEKKGEEIDQDLGPRLTRQLYDVYSWAVDGLKLWHRSGRVLRRPACLLEDVEASRRDSDPYLSFIDECLVFVADVEVEVRIVHGVFATWWRRNGFGEKVPPSNTMSRRLTEHGIPTKNRGKHGRWKVGIEIVQEYME